MNGDTVAVLVIFAGIVLFFCLPLIDNKPEERKGKIITLCAYLFILYALAMTIWSLLS